MIRNTVLLVFTLLIAVISVGSDLKSVNSGFDIDQGASFVEPVSDLTHLTLTFVGDIMAHEMNYRHAPYDNIYSDISPFLATSDLNFANLEFVVNPDRPYSDYPVFNVKPVYVEAAISAGFNVFSLANNHTNDFGYKSALKTLATVGNIGQEHEIWHSGIFDGAERQFAPTAIEWGEWRIGFLSVAGFLNRPQRKTHINVVNYSDAKARADFIDHISETAANYDLFVLSFHGGIEYSIEPSAAKAEFFSNLVNAGVDVVWGHHPHVVQPWTLQNVDGMNKLILYSTGNFISGQTWFINPAKPDKRRVYTGDSALFRITARKSAGDVDVVHVHPILVSNYKHEDHGMVVRRFPALIDGSLGKAWTTYYTDRLDAVSTLTAVKSSYGFF